MKKLSDEFYISLFSPKRGSMRDEVAIILAVLIGWGGVTFGFQFLLRVLGGASGESMFTTHTFFNLPFHFWFTGQFLPLWFVILCVIFNWYIDRITLRHSRKRDRGHD